MRRAAPAYRIELAAAVIVTAHLHNLDCRAIKVSSVGCSRGRSELPWCRSASFVADPPQWREMQQLRVSAISFRESPPELSWAAPELNRWSDHAGGVNCRVVLQAGGRKHSPLRHRRVCVGARQLWADEG